MKKYFIFFQFVLIILNYSAKSQNQEELLKKGNDLLIKQEYFEAEKIFKSILTNSSENVDALLSLGKLYFFTGEKKKAEESLKKVISLAPKYEDAYEILSNVYLSQHLDQESINALDLLYSINSNRNDILFKLLALNRLNGNFIRARELRDKLIERGLRDTIPKQFTIDLMKFQIDAIAGFESVDPKPNWNDQSLSLMYIYDKFLKFLGSIERIERFGLNDMMLSISTFLPLPRDFNWYLNFGFTPNSKILPKIRADLYLQAKIYNATSAIASVSLLNFASEKTHYYQIGIDQYISDYSLSYQFYFSETRSSAHLIRANWYGKLDRVTLGYAFGNEFYSIYKENLIDINTSSVFCNYLRWLTNNLGINLNFAYSHTNQPQDRIRIGLGVTTKF